MSDYSTLLHPHTAPEVIHSIGKYRPWGFHKASGGDGNTFPIHSGRLLDLKESRERGLQYFQNQLVDMIKKPAFAMAVVPSHDATRLRSGLHLLVTRVAKATGVFDGGDFLLRHTTIAKLANGGDRSIEVHINSMVANKIDRAPGMKILLIDDIMTTGNSLAAGRRVLMDAGAVEVECMALGRTSYD